MKQLKLQELIEQAKLIQPEEWVELERLIEQSSFAQRSFCDCSWETIPEQIKYLLITHLKISKTQLNNLPESIGKLSNLIDLDLSQNQLTNLPESMESLSNLSYLNLSQNRFTSLPKSINNLSICVNLSQNQLTSLPENAKIAKAADWPPLKRVDKK